MLNMRVLLLSIGFWTSCHALQFEWALGRVINYTHHGFAIFDDKKLVVSIAPNSNHFYDVALSHHIPRTTLILRDFKNNLAGYLEYTGFKENGSVISTVAFDPVMVNKNMNSLVNDSGEKLLFKREVKVPLIPGHGISVTNTINLTLGGDNLSKSEIDIESVVMPPYSPAV